MSELDRDALARFSRQILLAEVGRSGQARLCEATAEVAGDGLAHDVATAYARRAGFAAIANGALDLDALAPLDIASHAAPRAVLAGARAAVQAVSRALSERAVSDRAVSDRAVSDRAVSDRAVSDRAVSDRAVSERAVFERRGRGHNPGE
ncbi:MAG: hypothetical protein EXR75_06885 [Myxococcales bacterium]|nr:hypothetical protein [Myxococcales bacterium]